MKVRFILILISFSLFASIAYSQPFEGGFFVGFTASQIDGDTYSGYNKPGLTAGAYISRDINYSLNWKAELRYAQRGAYNKGTEQDPSYYKITLHYIEIPLVFQYEVFSRTRLDLGLAPDIYLFHREEDEYGELREEDYPAFHPVGLGALAGINYNLNERWIAGVRYNYSIVPIRSHPSGQTYLLNRGQYSNVLSLTIYYHIK